ncbi:TetR/AcrR family transcriptional regulator [Acetobacter sp.]|uniref:TetR/AcrR family transcriptional regulator n=1 Tax=Acetobacter sp. TaxID=440 RepID=UPI0039EA6956
MQKISIGKYHISATYPAALHKHPLLQKHNPPSPQQQNPLYKHTVWTVCFSMSQGTKRTKRPEAVKSDVLNAAARILTTKGIQSFTLDLVAKEAGVSKGGLLHHFANKKSLLDGLFLREMEVFREDIISSMAKDPVKEGRAVRAYIGLGRTETLQDDAPPLLRHLLAVMLLEPQFCTDWTHHYWETIKSVGLFDEITTPGLLSCLAADGLSLWNILGVNIIEQTSRDDLYKLIAQLTSPSKESEQ